MKICEKLCTQDFHKMLLDENVHIDCVELSTLPSILQFLGVNKIIKKDLEEKCVITYDDSDNMIYILKDNTGTIEDQCMIARVEKTLRDCMTSPILMNKDLFKTLVNFLDIKISEEKSLLNPTQEEMIHLLNERFIKIPPVTTVSLNKFEERSFIIKDLQKNLERERLKIYVKDRSIYIKMRNFVIEIDVSSKIYGCFRSEDLDLCVGEEFYIYIDKENDIVIKRIGEKTRREISIRHNIKSFDKILYSQPLGYNVEEFKENIKLRNWWISLTDPYKTLFLILSSHPYAEYEVYKDLDVISKSNSLILRIESDLDLASPWSRSMKTIEPVETEYHIIDERPLLTISPKKIMIHDIWIDSDKELYMLLINNSRKIYPVTIISSGYLGKTRILYKKGFWEDLYSEFNRLNFSMPPHSMALLNIEKIEKKISLFKKLSVRY
ncbi:MAG: hypothetical protein JHC19_03685 [Desulfurococcaceae archaeon]|nr:hypothetical protein [Desulfurococcaceae archaeon]